MSNKTFVVVFSVLCLGQLKVATAAEDLKIIPSALEATQVLAQEAELNAVPPQAEVSTPALKESEIPVLKSANVKKAEGSSTGSRLILSFLVMGLMVFGLIYFSKWYGRRNKKTSDNNKIRILTQHFIGPRKSIAIIRVAGETMLIGVTDQNISMLKSLSLIDDEFPDVNPKNFQSALSGADAKVDLHDYNESGDDFVVNNIKDKISEKIKSMRNI